MFAAGLIWYNPAWKLADPICSFIFAILVLFTTSRLIYKASHILMEGIPEGIDAAQVRRDLEKIDGVLEVHDLHIWSISVGKPALSVHLLADDRGQIVLKKATDICNYKHSIHHTTIQVTSRKHEEGSWRERDQIQRLTIVPLCRLSTRMITSVSVPKVDRHDRG